MESFYAAVVRVLRVGSRDEGQQAEIAHVSRSVASKAWGAQSKDPQLLFLGSADALKPQ